MRFMALILLFLVALPVTARAQEPLALPPVFDYEDFVRLPILHEGRIKPLDTFARVMLTGFYGKDSMPDISAAAWLAEMLFNQSQAYQRPVFNIANPDVLNAIGLTYRLHHRYSFVEVSQALAPHIAMIRALRTRDEKDLSVAQSQLLELYAKTMWYFEISRSLSLVLPKLSVDDPGLAEKMGIAPGAELTYFEMMAHRPAFLELAEKAVAKDPVDMTAADEEILRIGHGLQRLTQDQQSRILRIVPPQWAEDGDEWFAPWAVLESGKGSPETATFFGQLTALAQAYLDRDSAEWGRLSKDIHEASLAMADGHIKKTAVALEYGYNQLDLFRYSLMAYIAALVTLMAGGLGLRRFMRRGALVLLSGGALMHLAGLCARMYIMGRPPVATLYESIIFVGLVTVVFALVLEWRQRRGLGILIGAATGSILQFIGMKYAVDGDSMGMLVAVLDTNFWLATHVVTITIAYGCCLVAGLLGHLYLLVSVFHPGQSERLNELGRNMLGVVLVALFFATLGTILGGIWADQSWGRFWGWDPKENGAMLIGLWLAWMLHARLAGILSSQGFAMAAVLTTVVVALAWFGVNLLNVGLHSYGFTKGIATNLGLFCGFEILFVGLCALYLKTRREVAS